MQVLISFMFFITLGMVHPDNIPKPNVSQVVSPLISPVVTKVIDIREHFENREEFELCEDML